MSIFCCVGQRLHGISTWSFPCYPLQQTDDRLLKFLAAFDSVALATRYHTWPPLHETDSQRLVCIRIRNIVTQIIQESPEELCAGDAARDIMEQVSVRVSEGDEGMDGQLCVAEDANAWPEMCQKTCDQHSARY